MNVGFFGKDLLIEDERFEMDYPIRNAFALGSVVVVLFDPDAFFDPRNVALHQVPNLCGYNRLGERLWIAEYPDDGADYYSEVLSKSPLECYCFGSYKCVIDPSTGRIKSAVFCK